MSDSEALCILGSWPLAKEGDSSILPEGHDETGMYTTFFAFAVFFPHCYHSPSSSHPLPSLLAVPDLGRYQFSPGAAFVSAPTPVSVPPTDKTSPIGPVNTLAYK